MSKTCANCQYYRDSGAVQFSPPSFWCSNSQSSNSGQMVAGDDSCDEFVKRGRKAGLFIRVLNWMLRRL